MQTKVRIYSFTSGPFQATVYPVHSPAGDPPAFTVDLYHGGNTYSHPRFVCTREEVGNLVKLALAADTLVREFLARGRGFEEWCRAAGVNPFDPDLAG
ncbi:MAG: hypothetical protein ABGY75_11535 [Gemmataceae bacterium]